MRTLIVGAGAVGGYFGMKLARAGSPVTFLARGETLRQLRETGLRVESDGEGSFLLSPVDAVESPAGHGPFELVFVCVKAQDTALAVGGLGAVLAPDAIVLSLQNGIESEETIERRLGIPPMLRAVAFIGAESTAPGVIRHVSGGTIVLGEPDDRPSARLERLVAVLRAATIAVRIPESIRRAKWQKLAWNASFNTIAAITGRNVAAILADPAARRLVETVMAEVEAVANARGVTFEPAYIPRVLHYTVRELGAVRPSTLQDRERGRPLEHAALTGAIVREGERLGIPTPACAALDALAGLLSGPARNR